MEVVKWCNKCGIPIEDVFKHIDSDHPETPGGKDGYIEFEEKHIYESNLVRI